MCRRERSTLGRVRGAVHESLAAVRGRWQRHNADRAVGVWGHARTGESLLGSVAGEGDMADTIRVVSWNMGRRTAAWRPPSETGAEVALLQEAAAPPPGIAPDVEVDPGPRLTGNLRSTASRRLRGGDTAVCSRSVARTGLEDLCGRPTPERPRRSRHGFQSYLTQPAVPV